MEWRGLNRLRAKGTGRAAGVALACSLLAQGSLAQETNGQDAAEANERGDAVYIELNKLEPQPNGACRTYFVAENRTKTAFSEIGLDVFIFRTDGVIAQRVAMTIRPIAPERTRVVLFDLVDLNCADIGRFLLNDVLSCRDADGADVACGDRIVPSSRAAAEFGG